MTTNRKQKIKRIIQDSIIVAVSVGAVVSVMQWVQAGNLNPTGAPASTMRTLSEVYDPLASISFDASSITANPNGSAIKIMRCAIKKFRGQGCP